MIALSGALFTVMIDRFIGYDMIFSFWGEYLNKYDKWYLKPLWGCAYCTNIWVISGMLLLFYWCFTAWAVLLALSAGSWVISLLYKYDLE